MTKRDVNVLLLVFTTIILLKSKHVNSINYKSTIIVNLNNCFNETCYNNITDYANSPLVECSYLPEQFYECNDITLDKNSSNCSKWGGSRYEEVTKTITMCSVFDGIECRGNRTFPKEVPCIKYTNKYFISTVLYSIFLGIFAVDRFCIGQSGIGVGKLITIGGLGVWWIIDIILLVLGVIKPNDDSNWIPYY